MPRPSPLSPDNILRFLQVTRDPVAANEVLRHLRIPQRIGLVLQGEGLLNDATALLIYRAAVTAAAGSFSLVGDAPILVLAAVASLAAGYVLARRRCTPPWRRGLSYQPDGRL